MVYLKRGKWCVRIDGVLRKFKTEEEALEAAGVNPVVAPKEKPLIDPLAALAALADKSKEESTMNCLDCDCNPCECEVQL